MVLLTNLLTYITLDPSLPDSNGKNGLHYASEHCDEEILKLLLDHITTQRYTSRYIV